jgi:tRNA(Arg) A34 adenosine deaminase TadA
MFDFTPGVRAGWTTILTADHAAAYAIGLAEEAASRGAFGVGGFLLDRTGRVIAEAVNAVARKGHVVDPTAHVERQLIDWCCEAGHRGLAASTSELTIVSSIDPCPMCTGAILRFGMNVIAVAEDKLSGVHHAGKPHRLPHELWDAAAEHMALFGVRGMRQSTRTEIATFASEISPDLLHRAEQVFVASVEPVNRLIADIDCDSNCRHVQITDSVRAAVCKASEALGLATIHGSIGLNVHEQGSRAEITNLLAGDGSVIVDEFGNLIAAADGESVRAARTSVLDLVRAYPLIRNIARNKSGIELPHQRYCSIVKQSAHSEPAKALLEFGALGSFLAARRKTNMLPAIGYLNGSSLVEAKQFAASLPPLYTSIIGIDVGVIPAPVS